jgi:starch-binding outer membrane protein, SusD/RagB family
MEKMKINIPAICFFACCTVLLSCTDYLDQAPEAEFTDKEIFGTFESFQGFVEELYQCTPQYTHNSWVNDWHMADEILANTRDWRFSVKFDQGDYWEWFSSGWGQSYLNSGNGSAITLNNPPNGWTNARGLWPLAWYGIRKANLGLANFELLTEASQEEKNAIKGQLLFFRGVLHFQLMSYWGGLPYIDRVLGTEALALPRLNYQETARKAAEDLAEAAKFLPINWDTHPAGRRTQGDNQQRITSAVAYAYMGKNLLYAASPLMNRVSTGNATFDQGLCREAAEALYKAIRLTELGDAPYSLIEWERYHENFYTIDGTRTGLNEHMFNSPPFWNNIFYDSQYSLWWPQVMGGDGNMIAPTHNYVKNFGMNTGYPIDDPNSGFDPADPWSNRDPRFYQFIVHDGVRIITGGNASHDNRRYANLYRGGNYRNDNDGSRTGYLLRKFTNLDRNNIDNVGNLLMHPPYLRLADVYLMYAEAILHGFGSATQHVAPEGGFTLTGVDAVNRVRNRVKLPDGTPLPGVPDTYVADNNLFMEYLIKERAVELMSEANIRWHDLRRWLLADQMKYREKTAINFDRDTINGKVVPINMQEVVVVTRVFEDRHWWLPLPPADVSVYPEFGQNPGW